MPREQNTSKTLNATLFAFVKIAIAMQKRAMIIPTGSRLFDSNLANSERNNVFGKIKIDTLA